MEADRWKRLQELFEEAAGLDEAARERLLEARCGEDPALRRQIEMLLHHDLIEGASITGSVAQAAAELGAPALAGTMIGPYRVEREIGHGGMGSVYLAVRDDDAYRKQVAIKLVRGAHRPEILKRFRSERRILAALEHPHIAHLIDGGETASGEPYVVMEYVAGEPIDVWCNTRRLPSEKRLALFRKVCSAVQHAHRNLIVHRDLKPGNILVNAEGEPKLLDFGIAKLLDPELHEAPATRTHVRVMTPEYASPEQVKGEPVTTASDVYSLGVLLHVLLAGRLPYRLTTGTYGELERAITATEPDRPSLPGDLGNIVLMALRKEPSRRYASVSEFSEDIWRHLEGLPVMARRSTFSYRTGKFLRRHPLSSAAAIGFVVTVVGFGTLALRQSRVAAAQRDRARVAEATAKEEAQAAQTTSQFLIDLFKTADPRSGGNRNMTVEEALKVGLAKLEKDDTLEAKIKVDLHATLGFSLMNLGDQEEGIRSMSAALDGTVALYGRDSLETAERLHRLGDFMRVADRYDEAWALLNEALEIRRRHIAGDDYQIADSYNNLAILAVEMGKLRESDEMQTASVAMHRRLNPEGGPIGTPVNNLALLRHRQGKLDEALSLARESRALVIEANDRSSVILVEGNIGRILMDMGEYDKALEQFEICRVKFLEVLGPEHRRTLRNTRDLAEAHHRLGHYGESETLLRDLLVDVRRALGDSGGDLGRVKLELARLLRDRGNLAEAERHMRESLSSVLASVGEKHFIVPGIYRTLAAVLLDRGAFDEAAGHLARALALMPAPEDYPHIETARILIEQARLHRLRGENDAAGGELATARALIAQTNGERSLDMGRLLLERAYLSHAAGDAAAMKAGIESARPILEDRLPEGHRILRALGALATEA